MMSMSSIHTLGQPQLNECVIDLEFYSLAYEIVFQIHREHFKYLVQLGKLEELKAPGYNYLSPRCQSILSPPLHL